MVSLIFVLLFVVTVFSIKKNVRNTILVPLSISTIFLLICVCILVSNLITDEHICSEKIQLYETELESISVIKEDSSKEDSSISKDDIKILIKEGMQIYNKELQIKEKKIELSKVKWYLYFGK